MAFEQRIALIQKIEQLRNSRVICYLTSVRPGIQASIAEDAVRVICDHLLAFPSRPVEKLDIFLVSNGGSGIVPWRLVALFREFAKKFNVLIPYRAYSAASLIALGADEIVMHPFAELGPIDPTVSNDFNPSEQGRKIGISVEDVGAYVHFIKETVGITHEDELVKAVEILADKVHPLALGNVERFVNQSRMIANKILRTHMSSESDAYRIKEIIENMASKLYFHGHPINRKEAKEDLSLKVSLDLSPELETTMWRLYEDYEEEFKNREIYMPLLEVSKASQCAPHPVGAQSQLNPGQIESTEVELTFAIVESATFSDSNIARHKLSLLRPQFGQKLLDDEMLSIEWRRSERSDAHQAQHS